MSISRDIAAWLSATTSKKGPIELATQGEADASDDSRALTPSTLFGVPSYPGGFLESKVFSANGTWTKPAGCTKVEVTLVGGGGGGAGAQCTSTGVWRMGGGGGGAGKAYAFFDADNFGATVAILVGAAGAAGAAANGAGGLGGTSSFNGVSGAHYCFASGGTGGQAAGANNTWGTAGSGLGGLSAGDIVNLVASGETSQYGHVAAGGICGSAGGGTPGSQKIALGTSNFTVGGTSAGGDPSSQSSGCGGGGSVVNNAISSLQGTAGISGIVIVSAYG